MSNSSRQLIRATESIAKNFGIKYCTKCNLSRPVDGGRIVPIGRGRTRWECSTCVERKKPSGFSEKRKKDAVPGVQSQDGVQPDEKL